MSVREWRIASAILIIASGVAFLPTFQILVGQWMTNDTYSFGVLVPPISAYFVWLHRKRLQQLPISPEPLAGMMLLGVCAVMLVGGRIVGVIGIQEIAMVLTVPALLWLLCGRRIVAALWFPLLYLLLMIPIWEILTDRFHYRFQLFSAVLSEQLLGVIGVPVHRHENFLELPNVTLEVASVCSGVNFLIAVIAIGVPQAYLFLQGAIPRAVVIGFAVAVAIFSNGLRIAIIGGLSHYQLTTQIHGPGHVLQGLFVSSAGLIALQFAIGALARRYPKHPKPASSRPAPRRPHPHRWQLTASVIGSAAVILIAAGLQPHDVLAAAAAGEPPLFVTSPRWQLVSVQQAISVVKGGPHPNLGNTFQIGESWTVELYTGELAYAESGGGLGYRRVNVPTQTAISEVPVATPRGTVMVNNVSFRDGERETDVVFWYEVNGEFTSQVTTAKLNALWGLVTGARPLPKLIVVTRTRATKAAAAEPLGDFVADVFSALQSQPAASIVQEQRQSS